MQKSIPKHIHQIWWQGESNIPKKYHAWRQTWRRYHPEWEFTLWDETKMNEFVKVNEPELLDSFLSWPKPIHRADAFRYVLLKHVGGWYIDIDIECLKSIVPLHNEAEVLLSKTTGFNNAVMGGIQGHVLWETLVTQLPKHHEVNEGQPEIQNGPRFLSTIIEKYEFNKMPGVVSLPHYIFEPLAPYFEDGNLKMNRDIKNSYAIHYQTLGWMNKQEFLLSKISQHILSPVIRLYLNLTKKKT
jgi:mannosyltransferase OCH1-like enzyme